MSTERRISRSAAKAALTILVLGALYSLWASGSAIGMISANGNLQVDHARVAGNGTVFDGSLIQTEQAPTRIRLSNGAQFRLAAASRATIYQHRLVLEAGEGEMDGVSGYELEARSLKITGASPDALARIKLDASRSVLVAAVRGSLRVANSTGMLVARIEAGEALNLEPQTAGATAATQVSGCLLEKGGHFIVVDRTTNVILELQGTDLAKNLGNRVEVSGRAGATKPQLPEASQVIAVAGLKVVAKGGCTALARKIGASTVIAAGAGTAAGVASGAGSAGAAAGTGAAAGAAGAAGAATAAGVGVGTVAVIGGVAAASTVGGLAVVGDLPGQGPSTPTASR